ncbi:hypothetical protein B0H63DRAFT_494263 [Podospora didyma]|uniref:Exonuclease 1 n=1 Tax=Podospora didyma TaxID=330526 RepID=A0AAE0NP53_9PEZI|nr:hypothetical protein B0H63DRAFT_494263 [Podospora didyma]
MGITGLLPLLKSIHRPTELKKYAGETFGIDGYGWLHRGAIGCAVELAQGKQTRKYVDFAMHRVRMFKHYGVTPYVVFDGDYLPSKAKTEESREHRREASKKLGMELLKAGKASQAYAELQKAIDVTPEMARLLIEELKKAQVPYVVAPYEADSQLVYLERQGIISGIVSEDSDLLVFGAKRLLTKMDKYGQCIEINRRDFCAVREISLTGWTDSEFRHMAIFSGCDYLAGVNNMGLKTAYRMIRKHRTPERVIKMLQFDGERRVPANYLAEFKQAELTFLYQRVFCPKKQEIVFLTEPDPSLDVANMPFIGSYVETELARSIALGDVNPITKQRIVILASPSKRRISQTFPPADTGNKRLGKPITDYFAGHRRIPLGEMDPNCFAVVPGQANGLAHAVVPRPVVFPLPRPYLEEPDTTANPARRYKTGTSRRKTEPVTNLLASDPYDLVPNRRRTMGPAVEVYQDLSASMRPPKKARLCEDLPTADTDQAPETSKYFAAPTASKPKKKAALKVADPILMSDDSIDEALLSFEELVAGGKKDDASPANRATRDNSVPNEEVEIPVSPSQVKPSQDGAQRKAVADTPPKARLQQFAYTSTRTTTRTSHGLPTPSSSMQNSTSASNTPPKNILTPRLTPLQRLGAQALQRGTPRAAVSGGATPSKDRRSFGELPLNPALVPLPKVDIKEVKALNKPLGSEDQLIPESDDENDPDRSAGDGEGNITWSSGDRLREHAMAFDGLLSLIPAKMYYGEDTSDQWKKKKQTKEEAKAAKRGKLDPDSELNRDAKDVMDERARSKRKLREMEAEDDESSQDDEDDLDNDILAGVEREKPGEGLKKAAEEEKAAKKQKIAGVSTDEPAAPQKTPKKQKKDVAQVASSSKQTSKQQVSEDTVMEDTPSKTKAKDEKKLAKKLQKEEKKKTKAEKSANKSAAAEADQANSGSGERKQPSIKPSTEVDEEADVDDMVPMDLSGLVTKEDESTARSTPQSAVFDSQPHAKNASVEPISTTTSISSAVTPSEKPKYIKLPADISGLRARLDAKIEALRAARKADDADGTPIRTRQELIEARRKKQLQRREHKKEMRQKQKEEEDLKREEALASSQNSPNSMLSPLFEQNDEASANHFAFGRLAFTDGTQMSHDLSYTKAAGAKKKGPSDPKTALLKFEAQKKRFEALNDEKRKEVLEKETWLAARRRAEGEKVHDNEALLKKALKRKESAKKKSEREWSERAKGVSDAIKSKQHKREENLKARRDGKGAGKGKKKGVATKKKSRPGFEGGGFGGGKKK